MQDDIDEVRPEPVRGPENNLWQRDVYRPGDGDKSHTPVRPGGEDALKIPSRGYRT